MTTYHHPGVDSSETLCGKECGPEHVSTKVEDRVTCVLCVRKSLEGSLLDFQAQVSDLRKQVGLLIMLVSETLSNDSADMGIVGEDIFQARYNGLEIDDGGGYRGRYYPTLAVNLRSRVPLNQGGMDIRDYIPPRVDPSKIRLVWTKEGYFIKTGSGFDDIANEPEEPSSTSRWAGL